MVDTITEKLSIDQTKDNPIDKFPWVPFGRSLLSSIESLEFIDKAWLQNNLALVLKDLGDYQGAKSLLEKAVKLAEQNFGVEHPTTAVRYSNLALVNFELKEKDAAITLLEKAYRVYRNHLGEEHPTTKLIKENLDIVKQQAS